MMLKTRCEDIKQSILNGNITSFNKEIQGLSKLELIDWLYFVDNYTSNKVYLWTSTYHALEK